MLLLAPVVFLILMFVAAPYGRFSKPGWGPVINNRLGWFLMELPASLLVAAIMLVKLELDWQILVFLLLWQLHYFHRAFIYPMTLRGGRPMPLLVVCMGVLFNIINAYLIGFHFVFNKEQYLSGWFDSPQFLFGLLLFLMGYVVTKRSDSLLRNLRSSTVTDYQIPRGFLFRYVSCPNYLGEIVQWVGWAILTWSAAGVVFMLWTLANLLPRALVSHRWYLEHFPDYPASRKAIVPFLL